MEIKKILESEGFLYGYGLFETMQAYQGKIFALEEHLERLYTSAKKISLNITQSPDNLESALRRTLKKKKLAAAKNAYLRLNVWKEGKKSNFSIIARKFLPPPLKKYQQGFKTIISSFRTDENSPLSSIKSLNYLKNILAMHEAKKGGFDEAILLNNRGFVAEGSRSNIFIVKNGRLLTPSLDNGILPGITRKIVINLAKKNKISVKTRPISLRVLTNSDEVFLTNSLKEIMPVKSLGRLYFNNSKFSLTNKIINLYQDYIAEGLDKITD